jgi:hypothetical protein
MINIKQPKTAIKPVSVKTFVRNFNFPFPNWKSLPLGFPNCDIEALSREEKHLFGAIKLAWVVSEGRGDYYRNFTKKSILTIGVILILFLAQNVLTNPKSSFSKAVNAATVSATLKTINIDEVMDSTMSALINAHKR